MSTYHVKVSLEPCNLTFNITSPEKINQAIEKKLQSMGFPEIWATPNAKAIDTSLTSCGLVSDETLDRSESIPLSSPIDDGIFECTYQTENHSINVKLSGTFSVWSTDNILYLKDSKFIYISAVRAQDGKKKPLKFPKDNFGMSDKIEANVSGSYEEIGTCYQIPATFIFEEE